MEADDNNQTSILRTTYESIKNFLGDKGEGCVAAPTEESIREKAYLLWEQAGRPECDGVEFWVRAEQELSAS